MLPWKAVSGLIKKKKKGKKQSFRIKKVSTVIDYKGQSDISGHPETIWLLNSISYSSSLWGFLHCSVQMNNMVHHSIFWCASTLPSILFYHYTLCVSSKIWNKGCVLCEIVDCIKCNGGPSINFLQKKNLLTMQSVQENHIAI